MFAYFVEQELEDPAEVLVFRLRRRVSAQVLFKVNVQERHDVGEQPLVFNTRGTHPEKPTGRGVNVIPSVTKKKKEP